MHVYTYERSSTERIMDYGCLFQFIQYQKKSLKLKNCISIVCVRINVGLTCAFKLTHEWYLRKHAHTKPNT